MLKNVIAHTFVWSVLLFLIFSYSSLFCQKQVKAKEENILIINSAPEGAEVFINGESKGFTPLELKDFKTTKFLLKLSHKDFKPLEQTLTDISGRREFFFVLDGEYGLLNLNSEPAGAKVKINNKDFGITPLLNIKLPLGLNKLKLELENYEVLTKTVYINRTRQNVNTKMTYLYSFLSFDKINRDNTKSEIYIDNEKRQNAEIGENRLQYGEHSIIITNPEFHKEISSSFQFDPERKYRISYEYNVFTLKYALCSAIIPGLGQFLDNSKLKGSLLTAAATAGAVLIFTTDKNYKDKINEYNENLAIYKAAKSEIKIQTYKELVKQNEADANDLNKRKNLFIAGLIGIYALNLVDAIIFHTKDYEIKILPASTNVQTGINLIDMKLNLL